MATGITTLWRPVGAYELQLMARANFSIFPPRMPEQPIFYPVCNEQYAGEIARKWNMTDSNSGFSGFVTRFQVPDAVAFAFPRRVVGAHRHEELWVPASELDAFCEAFLGPIIVVGGWLGELYPTVTGWSGPLGEMIGADLAAVVSHLGSQQLHGGPLTEKRAEARPE